MLKFSGFKHVEYANNFFPFSLKMNEFSPTILKPRNVFPTSAAHVHMIVNLNVAQIPCMAFPKRKFKELFLDCSYKH